MPYIEIMGMEIEVYAKIVYVIDKQFIMIWRELRCGSQQWDVLWHRDYQSFPEGMNSQMNCQMTYQIIQNKLEFNLIQC